MKGNNGKVFRFSFFSRSDMHTTCCTCDPEYSKFCVHAVVLSLWYSAFLLIFVVIISYYLFVERAVRRYNNFPLGKYTNQKKKRVYASDYYGW